MKGTTPRILSFLMALALLASTFAVVAGPSPVAEAATNNTFDAVNPATSRSFATVAGDNVPLFIALSPNYAADKTIYAAVSTGGVSTGVLASTKIVRSTDGGVSWTNGLNPLTSLTTFGTDVLRGMDVASNGSIVLLVTTGAANTNTYGGTALTANRALLFRSTDGGSSFTNHSVGGAGTLLASESISAASVTPATGAAGGNPVGFAIAPNFTSNGQVLVALANGNVARYDQNRANWEALAFNTVLTATALSVAFHPNYASNEEIWAVGNVTVGTTTVVARIERLNAAAQVGLALDGANPWDGARIRFDRSNVVWVGGRRAAGAGGNILELVGSTWTARGVGATGWGAGTTLADGVADFAVVSGTGSTARIVVALWSPVTATTYTRLTRSGGQTPGWTSTFNKQPGDIRGSTAAGYRNIAVGPDGTVWIGNADGAAVGNRGGLFAGRFSGSDFSFGPMGLTTATFAPASGILDLDASPNYGSDNTLSMTTDEGVWISSNLSPSTAVADIGWRLAFPATSLVSFAFSANYASDRSMYVVNGGTSGNKGFRSFDGGVLWETMKTTRDDGMPSDSAAFRKIVSGGSGILYAITDDTTNLFAVSTNHGDNWASKGPANGLNASDGRDVAAAGSTVAVGVRGGGTVQVYVSKDSGATFTRVGTANMGGAAADVKVFVSSKYSTDGVIIAGARDATQGTVDVNYGDLYRSVKDAEWTRMDSNADLSSGLANVSTQIIAVAGSASPINRLYAITTQAAGGTTGSVRSLSNYLTGSVGGAFRGPCSSAGVGTATSTFSVATGAGCSAPSGALAVTTGTLLAVGQGDVPVLFVSLGAANWLARISDLGVTAPTLVSPVDGKGFVQDPVGASYNDISLRWNSVSGMDAGSAYEVDVSEDPAFPSFGSTIRGRNMIVGNTTSWTYSTTLVDVQMPTLQRGKKYYWRVRVGDGAFSAVRTFSYDMLRPILSRPDNGTDVNSLNVFFAWKSTGIGATGTETSIEADRTAFELSTDVNFAKDKTKRVEFESLALAYEVDAPLVANTTYYWRVQGGKIQTDSKGVVSTIWGAFGGPYSFRTPPGAVVPPAPPGTSAAIKVADAFKAIAADVAIVWHFDNAKQTWQKYDPKAPAFANTFSDLAQDEVVLIIANKAIMGFKLGSRTYDLVAGNNYKAYIP